MTMPRRKFITRSLSAAATLAIPVRAFAQTADKAPSDAWVAGADAKQSKSDTVKNWRYATIIEAAEAIRSGKVSPVELTKASLERITQVDPILHSYAIVTPEVALAQARRAETEIAAGRYRGPLHGIPIAIK